MKTTVMTIALALGGMTLMAAQAPKAAPAESSTTKPAATATKTRPVTSENTSSS